MSKIFCIFALNLENNIINPQIEKKKSMEKMTITIQDWKHRGVIETLRIIRRALLCAIKQEGIEQVNGLDYNDYDKSGVELKIKWK